MSMDEPQSDMPPSDRQQARPARRKSAAQQSVDLRPLLVSRAVAAAMLGQISERLLDQLVASGRLRARRISANRVGYRVADLEALVDSLPDAS